MSTWSLTGVDMTAGLAVTVCKTVLVGLGVQSQSCAIAVHLDDSGQAPGGL